MLSRNCISLTSRLTLFWTGLGPSKTFLGVNGVNGVFACFGHIPTILQTLINRAFPLTRAHDNGLVECARFGTVYGVKFCTVYTEKNRKQALQIGVNGVKCNV